MKMMVMQLFRLHVGQKKKKMRMQQKKVILKKLALMLGFSSFVKFVKRLLRGLSLGRVLTLKV